MQVFQGRNFDKKSWGCSECENGLKYHPNYFKDGFLLGFGSLSDPSWYYHWQFRYFHIKLNKFREIFEIRQYFKFYRPSPNDVFLSPKPFKIRQIGDISPSLATLSTCSVRWRGVSRQTHLHRILTAVTTAAYVINVNQRRGRARYRPYSYAPYTV